MGYYSYFNLTVQDYGEKATGKDVMEAIRKIRQASKDAFYPFEDLLMKFYENPEDYDNRNLSLEPEERFKWYDCDEEMTKLSRLLPDVTLKLHVEGEEAGDITDRYFKNGKHCSYEAKIPDFNPADLE